MFESGKESKIKTVEVTVQTGHASVPGVWSCPTSRMAHGGYFFCKIKFKKAGMSSAWTTQSVTRTPCFGRVELISRLSKGHLCLPCGPLAVTEKQSTESLPGNFTLQDKWPGQSVSWVTWGAFPMIVLGLRVREKPDSSLIGSLLG